MQAKVNHEMVLLARETRGVTQGKLCELVNIPQSSLSKFEHGVLAIPEDTLRCIANVLDYPTSFFYQNARRFGLGASFIYHRKRKTIPAKKRRQLEANLNVRVIEICNLVDSIEINTERVFPTMDVDDCREGAVEIAKLLRTKWKMPLGPIHNIVDCIESAGGILLECDFATSKMDSLSIWLEGKPPIFFVNSDIPEDRKRFTLAHELGHTIMHRDPNPDMEKQADTFASEFLMPKAEISSALKNFSFSTVGKLKLKWQVSIKALIFRAHSLGFINHDKYRRMCIEYNRHWRPEPFGLHSQIPALLQRIINIYRNQLDYSDDELATSVMKTSRADFNRYYNENPTTEIRIVR